MADFIYGRPLFWRYLTYCSRFGKCVFIYTKVLSIRQVLTEDYLLFSGTIADREHRKWIEKAVPLQNNPYSKESLEKRLSRTSVDSGTSTLQSRWVASNWGLRLSGLNIFCRGVEHCDLVVRTSDGLGLEWSGVACSGFGQSSSVGFLPILKVGFYTVESGF